MAAKTNLPPDQNNHARNKEEDKGAHPKHNSVSQDLLTMNFSDFHRIKIDRIDGWGCSYACIDSPRGVSRDDRCNLLRPRQNRWAVLSLLQLRNHTAPDIANLGIVQDALKAISHLNAALVLLDGKDHHNAFVGPLRPDLPLVVKLRSEIFDRQAIERLDGDNLNRCVGLLKSLLAQAFEALL